jgi:serine/threonine protein kinase
MCLFFVSETEQGIFEQVLKGELDFISEPWPSISESAKDLVRKMLVRDPKKRLTAHEVLCEYAYIFHSKGLDLGIVCTFFVTRDLFSPIPQGYLFNSVICMMTDYLVCRIVVL